MEYSGYVEHVRQDGQTLVTAAGDNLSIAVPTCPGWTVGNLVHHVAETYEHKIACTKLARSPESWPPEWPADRDPIEWLSDAHARLLEMFERSAPSTPSETWWPADQTVGFWARRMAHETAVHRVDAESATGVPTRIDAALAADGIDEILVLMLAGDWSEDPDEGARGQRVSISAGEQGWTVTVDREAVTVADGNGNVDASVLGDPSDVVLWLWGRAPDERVARQGDDEVLRILRERLVMATQ